MSNSPKKLAARAVIGVAGTILLGAIGSGLWERLFSPVLDNLLGLVAGGSGRFASWYVDHLHARIGRGLNAEASAFPSIALIGTFILFSAGGLVFAWRYRAWLGRPETQVDLPLPALPFDGRSRFTVPTMVTLSLLNLLMYSDLLVTEMYQHRSVLWVERSLEIVRPSVGEARFLELRGHYRAVEDAEAFFVLWRAIRQAAEQRGIVLPKFTPIGA